MVATLPQDAHAALALLDEYVRIPTLSRAVTTAEIAAVRAFWRRLGLELSELWPEDGAGTPSLYGEIRGRQPGPTVLLYGHYDVQPTGDPAAWRWGDTPCNPWEPSYFRAGGAPDSGPLNPAGLSEAALQETLLVARGGADNKGQHVANILGVLRLLAAGDLHGTVRVLLDGEEEHGSPNLAAIATRHRDRLTADVVLASDGPKVNNAPTIVLGVRGLLDLQITVDNGRGQSVHSGNYGNIVQSPVLPLARLLAGLPERVAALARGRRDFHDAVLTAFADAPNRAAWEPFLEPTFNVNGLLSEGVQPEGRRTIIPGWARAKVDVRLTPDTPPDEVLAQIDAARLDEVARSRAMTISLTRGSTTPASYTPPTRPEFAAIVATTRAYWGQEPVVQPLMGGTLPAYVFTDVLGLPAYWLPGAQSQNRQHDLNEHLLLSHFFHQSAWYAAVLQAVTGSLVGA